MGFFRSGFDMQVFHIWKTSGTTYLRLPGRLPDYFHFSRLDFLKVIWTSWKSSGLPGSLLTNSSSLSSGVQACLCRGMIYNSFLDDLHFSRHRLVLYLTGLFQKFDFPGRLTFQSSREN
ncbi:hypothetical protein IGI04_019149 [Brassica rapa subsp. trilocularis]|uniref:Uncharacterized protein n=1 Tax=Brassica rapa subsp. trilocularis TaxID=1813537 RepID=A0ABQ7MF01_BRACM|nr:hypothetical protein IGI04_019149 [Brassica rapa subsp. trilocularis]